MALTNRYYGGTSYGAGRIVQDFSACDLNGALVYTARVRQKGLLVVTFFAPDQTASVQVVKALQNWTTDTPTDKWTPVGVAGPDRPTLKTFAEKNELPGITFLVDYDWYQVRSWGISNIPTTLLIDGKTGRVLAKVVGDGAEELAAMKQTLQAGITKIKAAEEAAKKAAEEKQAADAAAKAAAEAAREPAKV